MDPNYRSQQPYVNIPRASGTSEPPLTIEHQKQQKAQAKQELEQAIGGAHEVLFTASTVFPFVLFPDTVTIDRTKLTIAHRSFFRVAAVTSIRIEDILSVTASVGPFFGSVQITTRFFENENDKHYEIKFLTRDDALRLKRIMQGYIIATRKQINCSALSTSELADLLNRLGEGAPDES